MAYNITITNGTGTQLIVNDTYAVTATVAGYDNLTILPATETFTQGVDTYAFAIAATGTLTLHATDDGTAGGTPIEGATFVRCDAVGNPYGTPIVSDIAGAAVFANVPFAAAGAPLIYFRQTASDGAHDFDGALQNTSMATTAETVEIENPAAALRTLDLTDANYLGLPIEAGEIVLT